MNSVVHRPLIQAIGYPDPDGLRSTLNGRYDLLFSGSWDEAVRDYTQWCLKIRVVLIHQDIDGQDGIDLMMQLKIKNTLPEFIVVASNQAVTDSVRAIKSGAFDYVPFPISDDALIAKLDNAIENVDFMSKVESYTKESLQSDSEIDRRLNLAQKLIISRRLEGLAVRPEELMMLFGTVESSSSPTMKAFVHNLESLSFTTFSNKPALLVVEDDAVLRDGLRLLVGQHYDLFMAEDGDEARQLLATENQIDAVLLDIYLPDINGLDLLPEIIGAIPEVEVIVMTAYREIPVAVKALRSGASDYINKPFLKNDILQVIGKALQRRYARQYLPLLKQKYIDYVLSDEEKINMLDSLYYRRQKQAKKLYMSDVYLLFPELRSSMVIDDVPLPQAVCEDGVKDFVLNMKKAY